MYRYFIFSFSILAVIVRTKITQKNVFKEELQMCSTDPITGYNRNGYCETQDHDQGTHVVCAQVTDEFLQYSKSMGNDLITKNDIYQFPGLKDGDHWCLCVLRWKQAYEIGKAPPVILEATNQKALQYTNIINLSKKTPKQQKLAIHRLRKRAKHFSHAHKKHFHYII